MAVFMDFGLKISLTSEKTLEKRALQSEDLLIWLCVVFADQTHTLAT